MKLREYQSQAVDAVMSAFNSGTQTTLVVASTGTGKTLIFGHIAKSMLQRGRVMVLVHRQELLTQAAEKIRRITGIEPGIEKAEQFSAEDSVYGKPPIVIASVQSLNSGDDELRRLHRFDPSEFSLCVLDEAHHGVAGSFRRCIDHFKTNEDCRVLLVTATPDRADERGLAEICQHVAFDYELNHAIGDGYLVPIHQRRVRIDGLEFARIRTVAGDFDQGELEAAMLAEKPLHGVVHATIEQACRFEIGYLETIRDDANRVGTLAARLGEMQPRKTLLFTVSVSHAERVAEIINRWIPDSAVAISGKTPKQDRENIIADFASGRIRFLANCAVALEGFDEPSIELVAMARPTKSRTIYAQALGRATRPAEAVAHLLGELATADERRAAIRESAKPKCEILDFSGNSGRHKLICAADILGTAKPDCIIERAAELSDESDIDTSEAIERAEQEFDRAREATALLEEIEADAADAVDERRVTAEAARRLNVVATAQYSINNVNAFDQSQMEPPSPSSDGPSPKQIDALANLGVAAATAANYSRRQASAVIQNLRATRCTNRQAFALRRHGFDEAEIKAMNFDAAMKALDEARNGATA
jgi:superfamily II DNA or RNA helicase